MKQLIVFVLCLFFGLQGQTQDTKETTESTLEGYWEGAFIKNNTIQRFEIHFFYKEGQLFSVQTVEDWHPLYGEFEQTVEVDSLGKIKMRTGYGKAVLNLDSDNLEIIGYLEGRNPSINIHFKKVPDPPVGKFVVEPVQVNNGKVLLQGHLHRPLNGSAKTAIIIVGGRSCYGGSTEYDLYGKVLREYGATILAYNKRGTGKSTGDCSAATITDLASDLKAWKSFLEKDPENFKSIGAIGSSAGGWVMAKSLEMTNFDFLISIVGPSTSVREQQFQSMTYGADFYDLSESARQSLIHYTKLMFDGKANKSNFNRINALLENAESEGWMDLLDKTDIPPSVAAIDSLWIRRHAFDPKETLSKFRKPFLGIYGEKDWVVPYKENIERLEELFTGDRRELLTTVVARQARHGTDVAGEYITLSRDLSYWRFFRISPQIRIEIINFLRKHKLIE